MDKEAGLQMGEQRADKDYTGRGACCPHCADSKFPCVKMEKAMKTGKAEDRTNQDEKQER